MVCNYKIIWPVIMKRILFLSFIGLWFAQNTKAQDNYDTQTLNRKIRWGLMLGPNYVQADLSKSKLPAGLEFKQNNIIGASIGLRATIPISYKLNLQTGINYHYFLFDLEQKTFGIDSLAGHIIKKPHVESWEIPLILTFKPAFKNNLLKNIYLAGGMGLALDHYKRLSETIIVLDARNNNSHYNYY